ncbi:UDP-glucose dehydrogenase family protein [Terrilactibacillus laevilacticus]|uniref:UDP-glucose dehydrogenase family protein n=1 Tax=Terrilactibacillus laevilacticus TaxID=1380157 RepID=UPI0011465B68|nr:UDP-glucose/GDP-mannose dehydrogenase family protein [Terrilactibacillus laevilacticus]
MKISVIGTGYVGLVTGVALSDIGHHVTCIDIDPAKVAKLRSGKPTIYEPGLEELMVKNIEQGRLFFTSEHEEGLKGSEVIYIAVGTPQREDGSANLNYVEQAAIDIATHMTNDVIVVTKSTVPVGTNFHIKEILHQHKQHDIKISIASNPEFLREGSAIKDTFEGDRIIIGTEDPQTADIIEAINAPFNVSVQKTDVLSAEMIKYSSNAFLATKISFINEIANICEKTGANVEEVAKGMGFDKRIGKQFLRAGIGYGGSCFPKDTNALVQIAGNHHYDFDLLKAVINVNNDQQRLLIDKIIDRFGSIEGKQVAVIGLAFKPNTDDIRESPALVIIPELVNLGSNVIAYDPIAIENTKKELTVDIEYTDHLDTALQNADFTVIITDWPEIKHINLKRFEDLMKQPIVFDGRNCYNLDQVKNTTLEYYSIGRPNHIPELIG